MEELDVVNDADDSPTSSQAFLARIRMEAKSPLDTMCPSGFKERLHGSTRPVDTVSPSSSPDPALSPRTSYPEIRERATSPPTSARRVPISPAHRTAISPMHRNPSGRHHPFHRPISRRSPSPHDDRSTSPPIFHPPPPASALHGALPTSLHNGLGSRFQRSFPEFDKREHDRRSPLSVSRSPASPRSLSPHSPDHLPRSSPGDLMLPRCSPPYDSVHTARPTVTSRDAAGDDAADKPTPAPSKFSIDDILGSSKIGTRTAVHTDGPSSPLQLKHLSQHGQFFGPGRHPSSVWTPWRRDMPGGSLSAAGFMVNGLGINNHGGIDLSTSRGKFHI